MKIEELNNLSLLGFEKLLKKKPEYGDKNILKIKTMKFAIKIVNLCRELMQDKKEFILSKQLLKSGTSIGANSNEAFHAQTKADFIAKLSISHKETGEASFWIDLLYATDWTEEKVYDDLNSDIHEINKIISRSLITAKNGKS